MTRDLRPPRAVFLDRDGTLCRLVPYLKDAAELELYQDVPAGLSQLRAAGYRLIVVTNQSGVARGLFTVRDVAVLHAELRRRLAAAGVELDDFLVCPHHPDHTGPCPCRKPAPGLLLEAARRWGVELTRSVMIGDTVEDMQAGAAAGCRCILVGTGYGAEQWASRAAELPPGTAYADDFAGAVALVVEPQAPRVDH